MTTDDELLRRFVENHSEAAFTELVQRHLALVRATALRRVGGDAHAADDVTQQIFVALARKAPSLRGHATLAGWLYIGTHHATADWVRREQRRKQREAIASSMPTHESPADPTAEAAQLRPLLDDALVTLNPDEREAVVLRFFSGRTFSEVGAALAVSEEAARKRVDRALAKLHAVLLRRGVTSTVAALGGALTAAGAQPVAAGLAAQVAGVALAKAAAPTLAASLAAALWPAAAAATLVGGTLMIIPQHRANADAAAAIAARQSNLGEAIAAARAENGQLEDELAAARREEAARQQQAAAVVPTPAAKPSPVVSTAVRTAGVAVSVSPEGMVAWEGKNVRLEEFLRLLVQHQSMAPDGESRIVVRAPGARFQQLNWVLDEARKAGIAHLVIESDAAPVGPMSTWF
jgi:RNA polymerase sigma factor (sigma-70 family)